MDAVMILLKCLKSKRYINDIDKAKKEVRVTTVLLKNPSDLFIRDTVMKMGSVLQENLDEHYYITTVNIRTLGKVSTQAIVLRNGESAEVAVYAHEGLIKQNLAKKALDELVKALS